MLHYNCLIVEDEPLAAEVIRDYVAQVPFLVLKGVCSDAIYAMEVLQRENIDLIFLDLHLPRLKGFEFLNTLQVRPQVIITTAYHEYALSGYEYNVLDYLLKPIEFSRFITAVNKLTTSEKIGGSVVEEPLPQARAHLFFNVNKRKIKIYCDEILFIESQREYIKIFMTKGVVTTKMQLHKMEELLSPRHFFRVHRSFIVARSRIDSFTAVEIEIQGHSIPIGRSYKELVGALVR